MLLICRQKNVTLRKVKKPDIVKAYVDLGIYIKHDARCCDAHLGENQLISENEFQFLQTTDKEIQLDTLKMFDMLASNYTSDFEAFKDLQYKNHWLVKGYFF